MAHRKTKQHTINFVKASFNSSDNLSYLDLFDGFNKLYMINVGYNLDFFYAIAGSLTKVEVILGNPGTVNSSLENTLAMQKYTMQLIHNDPNYDELISMVDRDILQFYLADAPLFIEKLYLLTNDEGQYRVIVGTSNMNQQPSNSDHFANILVFDDKDAFDYYWNQFDFYKNNHAYPLARESLVPTTDEKELLANLPILNKATIDEAHTFTAYSNEIVKSEAAFAKNITRLAKDFVGVPKPDRKSEAKITRDKIDLIRQKTYDNIFTRRSKYEKFLPQLIIDPQNNFASYNELPLNLDPHKADLRRDTEIYLEYLSGFDTAIPQKNVEPLKYEYFKLMTWTFLSPLLARIRTTIRHATVTDEVFTYPIVALLCGQSNAGKTIYVSLLMKMMTNSTLYKAFSQSNFTKTRVDSLMCDIKGLPILIDDITQTQFTNNSGNIIKQEERNVRENKPENLNYYPAMLLTANKDLNSLKNELTKRMVVFHVNASWNNEFTRQQESPCSRLIQKMSNSIYCAYLKKMFPHINYFLNEMTDLGRSTTDLYELSSKVLIEIFEEAGATIPSYMRPIPMKEFFNTQSVNEIMIKFFQNQYQLNREFFVVDKKNNQLVFEDKSANTVGKMSPMKIVESLPPEVEADLIGDKIVMRLDTAREFFGINFKEPGLFERFFS